MKKALLLFSGGLDSILAVKILKKQDCAVTALTFTTPFFDAERAKVVAENLSISIFIKDMTKEHFALVKNPPHGYGKNLNPCLDCHGLMFRLAGEIASKEGFDLVATGEVLGQRPFSQNKQALHLVTKIAGMEDKILRPLSAQKLPETVYEKKGLVEREKLYALQGRSRKPQMALAKKWGITDYPTPAGGCLLTEPGFAQRLRDLFEHHKNPEIAEINLLKIGRHFWSDGNKVIIGRDREENFRLREYFQSEKMLMLKLKDYPGPYGLIYLNNLKNLEIAIRFAAEKIKYYALRTRDLEKVIVVYWGNTDGEIVV